MAKKMYMLPISQSIFHRVMELYPGVDFRLVLREMITNKLTEIELCRKCGEDVDDDDDEDQEQDDEDTSRVSAPKYIIVDDKYGIPKKITKDLCKTSMARQGMTIYSFCSEVSKFKSPQQCRVLRGLLSNPPLMNIGVFVKFKINSTGECRGLPVSQELVGYINEIYEESMLGKY